MTKKVRVRSRLFVPNVLCFFQICLNSFLTSHYLDLINDLNMGMNASEKTLLFVHYVTSQSELISETA